VSAPSSPTPAASVRSSLDRDRLAGALVAAGAVAPLATLLTSRPALRIDLALEARALDQFGGLAFVAVFVAAVVASLATDATAALALLRLNAAVGGATAVAVAAVNDATVLRGLVALVILTSGTTLALGRTVALVGVARGDRAATWWALASWWSAAAAGVALVALHDLIAPLPNWGYSLGAAGLASLIGAVLLRPVSTPAPPPDAPAPRRDPLPTAPFLLLAASGGLALVATLGVGADHLATRWELTSRAQSGVLALAGLGAALVVAGGHWYHRLATRPPVHLGGAAGAAATVAGVLVAAGGASKTLVGVVGCWAVAGVAALLAVVAAETAVLGTAPAAWRPRTGGTLVAAGSVGAMAAAAGPVATDALGRGWILALAALPVTVVGIVVATSHPEQRDGAQRTVPTTAATTVSTDATAPPGVPGPDPATPLLEVRHLDAGYDSVQVLFDVSLEVPAGRIVALMGTNGAGKTTLLRTVAGLVPATHGSVHFGGVDVTAFDPTWRVALGMSQIAGGAALAEDLTVTENLRLFGHSLGRDRARHHEGVERAFELFPRLAERRNQAASTLSGGEKQMLALAKAVILRPRLLVIDEFSLGLAPKVVGELLPVVERLNAEGAAVLLVEQSVNIALSIADHAYCMEKGEIVYDGPAATLRDDPDLVRSVYLEGLTKVLSS